MKMDREAPLRDSTEEPEADTDAAVARDEVRARDYFTFDTRVLQGALPAVVFLVANAMGPAQVAIGLSFVTSAVVFVRNRGAGVIQLLATMSFAIVAVSAAVGLALDSPKAFVAQNAVTDFVIAVIFTVSVVVRRPLIGLIARELVPAIRPVIDVTHIVFAQLTLLSAALNVGQGVARLFMLDALSANEYVIISRVVFIPMNIAFYALCYWRVSQVAIRIWPADMPPPPRVR
jgi:hypothetical protein